MEQVQEIIQQVSGTLTDIAQSDVVVSEPIQLGNITLVAISRVRVGFVGAGGEGEGDRPRLRKNDPEGSGTGKGVGSGGAAVVRPVAVVVFGEDGVSVLPIGERESKLEKLVDQIPALIERFQKRGTA